MQNQFALCGLGSTLSNLKTSVDVSGLVCLRVRRLQSRYEHEPGLVLQHLCVAVKIIVTFALGIYILLTAILLVTAHYSACTRFLSQVFVLFFYFSLPLHHVQGEMTCIKSSQLSRA